MSTSSSNERKYSGIKSTNMVTPSTKKKGPGGHDYMQSLTLPPTNKKWLRMKEKRLDFLSRWQTQSTQHISTWFPFCRRRRRWRKKKNNTSWKNSNAEVKNLIEMGKLFIFKDDANQLHCINGHLKISKARSNIRIAVYLVNKEKEDDDVMTLAGAHNNAFYHGQ